MSETRIKLVRTGRGSITNAMKAECIGEFSFTVPQHCMECLDVGADEDCEVCGGAVEYQQSITVPWDTCKAIYAKMLDAAPDMTEGMRDEVKQAFSLFMATHQDALTELGKR